MTVLIVSASAVQRSAMKDLLSQVPGHKTFFETGSVLSVDRLLSEHGPQVVLWDEGMGDHTESMIRTAGTGAFHLVLLESPAAPRTRGPVANLTRIEKADFAKASMEDYSRAQVPGLTQLFAELEVTGHHAPDALNGTGPVRLVVLGASTGGPAATKRVLEGLPKDFPCPIALVQHIDSGYEAGYADWLKGNTSLNVHLARDGDSPVPGEVIVAPTGFHLVCADQRFVLDDGPKVFSQKPAVDRLFTSAADHFGSGTVGVLLTGIGSDGARGCRSILDSGGLTLVQDEATSTVWGMPKAAWEMGAASQVLPLDEIGPRLLSLVASRGRL
jgi:chemotaxis response regulator CheB